MTDATQETPHPFPVGAVVVERASPVDRRRWIGRFVVTRHFKKRATEEFASVALRPVDKPDEVAVSGRAVQIRVSWAYLAGGKTPSLEISGTSYYGRRWFAAITSVIAAELELARLTEEMTKVVRLVEERARSGLPDHISPDAVTAVAEAAHGKVKTLLAILSQPAPPRAADADDEAA